MLMKSLRVQLVSWKERDGHCSITCVGRGTEIAIDRKLVGTEYSLITRINSANEGLICVASFFSSMSLSRKTMLLFLRSPVNTALSWLLLISSNLYTPRVFVIVRASSQQMFIFLLSVLSLCCRSQHLLACSGPSS